MILRSAICYHFSIPNIKHIWDTYWSHYSSDGRKHSLYSALIATSTPLPFCLLVCATLWTFDFDWTHSTASICRKNCRMTSSRDLCNTLRPHRFHRSDNWRAPQCSPLSQWPSVASNSPSTLHYESSRWKHVARLPPALRQLVLMCRWSISENTKRSPGSQIWNEAIAVYSGQGMSENVLVYFSDVILTQQLMLLSHISTVSIWWSLYITRHTT